MLESFFCHHEKIDSILCQRLGQENHSFSRVIVLQYSRVAAVYRRSTILSIGGAEKSSHWGLFSLSGKRKRRFFSWPVTQTNGLLTHVISGSLQPALLFQNGIDQAVSNRLRKTGRNAAPDLFSNEVIIQGADIPNIGQF